jgi:hypothetical protein
MPVYGEFSTRWAVFGSTRVKRPGEGEVRSRKAKIIWGAGGGTRTHGLRFTNSLGSVQTRSPMPRARFNSRTFPDSSSPAFARNRGRWRSGWRSATALSPTVLKSYAVRSRAFSVALKVAPIRLLLQRLVHWRPLVAAWVGVSVGIMASACTGHCPPCDMRPRYALSLMRA